MQKNRYGFNQMAVFVVVLSALFAADCVASGVDKLKTDMATRGISPLNVTELKTIFNDVTGTGKKDNWQYARYTGPNGVAKVRVWGANFNRQDTGQWRVTDDGMMCIEYHGHFAQSGERCTVVYPGNAKNEFITAIVTGKKSKRNPSGILTHVLKPGDQSGVN